MTPDIPGPSESPCLVDEPSLFYLVDCMQHEMAVHFFFFLAVHIFKHFTRFACIMFGIVFGPK